MKRKILVLRNDKEIFKGKVMTLPMKEEFIIKKSIELFDDAEPCIIHQSYIVKEYATEFLQLFSNTKEIYGKDKNKLLQYLDFSNIEELVFKILGWLDGSLLR